ncbi:hypothetical protein RND81_12G015200 [Saponaria officinalis]|uniref:Uncharacterized protein n=1 Tax=Saponaria officinalis TaxID=3572 RepID=A0AAW1H420_SAPOF
MLLLEESVEYVLIWLGFTRSPRSFSRELDWIHNNRCLSKPLKKVCSAVRWPLFTMAGLNGTKEFSLGFAVIGKLFVGILKLISLIEFIVGFHKVKLIVWIVWLANSKLL